MAERYVALLRGINVGQAKRVAMGDLRVLVEDLGFTDVRTVLNSGNVVFTGVHAAPADLATLLQEALASRLCVEARVTVIGASALNAAVDSNPLVGIVDDPSRLLVAFPASPLDFDRLRPLAHEDWSPDAFDIGCGVAFMWCPTGVSKSRVARALDAALGDAVTSRNWSTVLKLQALVASPS